MADSRREFITTGAALAAGLALNAGAEEQRVAIDRTKLKTALLADGLSLEHDTGAGHPERPARYKAVLDALDAAKLTPLLEKLPARAATDDEVKLLHTAEYVALARREITEGKRNLSTGDTVVSAKSLEAALQATGAALNAVDAVIGGRAKNAFCVVRPPGHHATPARGMGFCVFNNVAVAARYAQQKHKLGKVLIVDWDVHHGNGTQDAFYEDGSVFFLSTHQSPWYPGTGKADETGRGKGLGCTLNVPLPAGSGRKEIYGVFEGRLLKEMERFKPELVLISAGFDSRLDDPLGKFTLSDEDFADLTRVLLKIAHDHAGGRLVSVLEGGYNLEGLGLAAAAHVKALAAAE